MGRAADLVAGCGWGARQQQGDWLAAAGLELTAGRSRLAASALAAWQVDLAASHPGTFYLPAEAAWGPAGARGEPAGEGGHGRQGDARQRQSGGHQPTRPPPHTPRHAFVRCPHSYGRPLGHPGGRGHGELRHPPIYTRPGQGLDRDHPDSYRLLCNKWQIPADDRMANGNYKL